MIVGKMLRIIGGTAGSRKIKTLTGEDTRPTADRVREALFNVLGARVIDCKFLDLFAGTGAVGIEALSRGARQAVFVEKNPRAVRVIRENLERMEMLERAKVLGQKLPEGLLYLVEEGGGFEIIFVDPPYGHNLVVPTLLKLTKLNLLKPDGWLVVETAAKEPLSPLIGHYTCFKEKFYGDTRLSYFRLTTETEMGGV